MARAHRPGDCLGLRLGEVDLLAPTAPLDVHGALPSASDRARYGGETRHSDPPRLSRCSAIVNLGRDRSLVTEFRALDATPYVGHPTPMRKTSVYLTAEEAEGLRQLAVREGRPQAELIREGVRRVIAEVTSRPRTFRSLGVARSGESMPRRWTSSELYRKSKGER